MNETNKISLRAARINANIQQKEAADKLGINVKTLQNYENGKSIPQWDIVLKIEELYKTNKDYIFFTQSTPIKKEKC